jgi:hypothetical protein
MPARILHIWFCPYTQSLRFSKTKRAKFFPRTCSGYENKL